MSFLFPLFLAAAGAVVAPFLLQLRRKPPEQRVEFSSLMFLGASPEVTSRRRRIERWFLLLLRCLALILLALIFARPYVRRQVSAPVTSGRAWLMLVDRSASMQREGLWSTARERLHEWLGETELTDTVTVAAFDQKLEVLLPASQLAQQSAGQRQALAASVLGEKPGALASYVDAALVGAVEELGRAGAVAEKRVVMISDMQAGSRVDALRGFAWPDDVTVTVDEVEAEEVGNLSLHLVENKNALSVESDSIRVRVSGQPHGATQDFSLRWGEQKVLSGQMPAGGSRIFTVQRLGKESALTLEGDEQDFDNTLHVAPASVRSVQLAAIDLSGKAEQAESPTYYLTRALGETQQMKPQWVTLTDGGAALPAEAEWTVVCGALPAGALSQSLKQRLEQGGHALWCMTAETLPEHLAALGVQASWQEARLKDYALLTDIDTSHASLAALADPVLRDFSKVHFWHYRELSALQGDVLAKFDGKAPAWLSVPVGKGKLVLMTSGWHPGDSQLAFSGRFIPLLSSLLQSSGLGQEQKAQYTVDAVHPKTGLADGQAYNLDPNESRTEPAAATLLPSLGVKLFNEEAKTLSSPVAAQLVAEEQESQQQYWLIALAALLWILGVETWLAGRAVAQA
jgi:hypothetical protein